jgi:peptide/nickel transport system substrate-binding protein
MPQVNQFIAVASEPDPAVLDPSKSGFDSSEFHRCCLARTLLAHNGRSTTEDGSKLHPDLAKALPEISADGLTWTFELKEGLRYGPPLDDVEITAQDFVRSFHRLLAPAVGAFFGTIIYPDIEGASEYAGGDAASISGLEAPDEHTLVIRLISPAGDLGARLALPMTSPLPPNPDDPAAAFGVAEGHDEGYGPFLVSSGPYMIEGSELMDFAVAPEEQAPASGLVAGESLTLVRNPSWRRSTDRLRPAYADRIVITAAPSVEDALAEIDGGRADLIFNPVFPPMIPPELASPYLDDPARGRVHVDSAGAVRGIGMNLAIPPFDDVHVRRAVNYATDKQELTEISGGPLAADVAGHMVPDTVEDNLLVDYHPYGTSEHAGDPSLARAEMARSRYDADEDGRCDASACREVVAVARVGHEQIARTVRGNFLSVGIELKLRVVPVEEFFAMFGDPGLKIPLFIGIGWSQSYIGASTYFLEQYYSPLAIAEDHHNGTLVGATREQLRRWNYDVVDVPNVDARIEACVPLVGTAQFECWAALDQYLMREVVPWIPFAFDRFVTVSSPRVLHYSYDPLAVGPALEHIAVSG